MNYLTKLAMIRAGIAVLVAMGLAAFATYEYMYPFGHRSCTLPCMHSALFAYAADHYGHFPEGDKGPYDALAKLYPEYTPSGIELAGVSGNVRDVVEALRKGTPFNKALTSWVYVPGLQKDDPHDIAILWESRSGLYSNGRRNSFGGHAVLLIGGDITNVPAANWEKFLKDQERLRETVLAERGPKPRVTPATAP